MTIFCWNTPTPAASVIILIFGAARRRMPRAAAYRAHAILDAAKLAMSRKDGR